MTQYKTPKAYLAAVERHNKKPEPTLPYRCYGGPYDTLYLHLVSRGTLPFQVGKWHGRYNESMQWIDA